MFRILRSTFLALMISQGSWAHDIERYGDKVRDFLPFAAAAYSTAVGDVEALDDFMAAYVLSTIATVALKDVTHKRRPDGSNYRSFPSGHTKTSFVAAAYLHRRYGFETALPAYLAASFVGYSRIHSKKHYPIDVLAGAGLAIGTVFAIVEPRENVIVMPVVTQDQVGFSFQMKF